MPSDLAMLEQTHSYHGMYYVLMGRLSPWMGLAPGSWAWRSSWHAPVTVPSRK